MYVNFGHSYIIVILMLMMIIIIHLLFFLLMCLKSVKEVLVLFLLQINLSKFLLKIFNVWSVS